MRVLTLLLVLTLVVVVRSDDIHICEGRVSVPDTAACAFPHQRLNRLVCLLLFFAGTCGGRCVVAAHASPSGSSNIDLAKNVRVELSSRSGVVKFMTEPDPSGRFVLPIYEQGRYVISVQGPPGWQMEPSEVAVNVDGSSCFAEFSFAGFALSGRIEGGELCADNIPLEGYEVELLNSKEAVVSSTLTNSNGSYNIKSVIPGKYRLKINEKSDNSDVSFKKNELSVDVSLAGGVVTDGTFVISGFNIKAKLLAGSERASVPGVTFLLFSDQVATVPCLSPPPTSSGALCSTVSDQEGAVLFSLLPCGGYRLVPSVSPSTLKISPSEILVAVDSGPVDVKTPFEVTGIALKGAVGVPGALVTAEHLSTGTRSKTSSDPSTGEYFFETLAPGVYKLSAEKEHYIFEELSEFKVIDKLPLAVPEPLKAIKFDVCGQVKAEDGAVLAVSTVNQRVLARGNSNEISTKTNSKGVFCLSLPRGTHTLTLPDLSTFDPIKVTVESEPILDVSFTLTRVSVSGKITSAGELPEITLELLYEGENQVLKTSVIDSEGKFAFEDVTAGAYIVRVAAIETCVADDSRVVHVGSDEVNDLEFYVAGYTQHVSADRKLSAVLECADSAVCGGSIETVSLRKGSNRICVPMRARYSLRIVQGNPEPDCVYFIDTNQAVSDRAPLGSLSFPVNTKSSASTKSLDLVGYSFLLHGAINVHAEKPISLNDLTVTAASTTRSRAPEVAIKAATGTKSVFKYAVRVLVGENVKLSFASNALYFEPAMLSYALSERECPPPLPVVTGRVPLVVSGSISPPVDGVSIEIVDAETRKSLLTTPLKTDADGKYTSEPLRTNGRVVVTPSRIGYTFSPLATSEHSFTSAQLAGISVHLRPCKGGEEGAEVDKSIENDLSNNVVSLNGALVALSAAQGGIYSNTSNENGRATFLGLSPGSYYVRALAKEFTFLPASQKVDLPSGAHVHVKVCAHRVAFSTMGCIKSLNSDPERQLAVEATEIIENKDSSEPHKEDSLTDQNGCYRLRGLKPSAKYAVTLRDNDERNLRLHRISPLKQVISTPALNEVNAGDVTNVNFTAMRRPPRVAIRGSVKTHNDFLSSLRVLLLSAPVKEKPEVLSETSLFPFGTFHFVVDAHKNYTIRLTSNLSRVIFDFDAPEVPVVLVNDPVSLEIEFNAQRKFEGSETDQSSLVGFWLLILAVALYYYREQVMVLLDRLRGKKPAVSPLADDRHNDWQSGWNHKKPKRR